MSTARPIARFLAGLRPASAGVLSPVSWGAIMLAAWLRSAADAPLGEPGTVATYVLEADLASRHAVEREKGTTVVGMEMRLGPVERLGARDYQWFGLGWRRANGQAYQAWVLVDGWPRGTATYGSWPAYENPPRVAHYLWQEPDWESPIEFVNEETGEVLLPPLSLWLYGWPQEIGVPPRGGLPVAELAERVQFIGWPYRRERLDRGAAEGPPAAVRRLALNPNLMVGNITTYRDAQGRIKDHLKQKHYDYRVITRDDARRDFEAGLNYRLIGRKDPEDCRETWQWPVWHRGMFSAPVDYPAYLFRANYLGRHSYTDEPAMHTRAKLNALSDAEGRALTPEAAAERLKQATRTPLWADRGNYSQLWWNLFVDDVYSRGNIEFVDPPVPSWECFWETAWYQLSVTDGVSGMVNEDAYPHLLVNDYNQAFGTRIPPTIENACKLHVAVMRGAARNFHKRWGVAQYIYDPEGMDARGDMTAFKAFYDAGATWFWNWYGWPGLSDAVVPYSYKRYMADWIRQCQAANPRRDLQALLHAARAAIAIPYGYTFSPGPLFGTVWLPLDRTNPQGKTYREILANAAQEAERYLRTGIAFDVVVDEPAFRKEGYEEIVYCRADGTVVIERDGLVVETRQGARPVTTRPDLGPAPSLTLELVAVPPDVPGEVRLRALAAPGSGELVANRAARALLYCEAITPAGSRLRIEGVRAFDAGGIEVTDEAGESRIRFRANASGRYFVRAAVADEFGKTAVQTLSFDLTGAYKDAEVFPAQWQFRLDPADRGVAERWFAENLDESDWRPIVVPAWWEDQGHDYDGQAWYRVRFRLPPGAAGLPARLYFQGVDEEAWVYVNGRLVGERTVQSTGLPFATFWDWSFHIAIPEGLLKADGENLLAVRCRDNAAKGGIFRPVRLQVAIPKNE